MSADNVHATKGERMYDTGSTTFMLICTMLVFLMTPGLAFFYGGLSRRKNVINTMLMCFGAIGLVGVLWIVAGWSLAYGGDGSSPFTGGLDQLLCLPVLNQVLQAAEGNAADGAVYPQIINIAFQMAFAMITAAIVTGSLAGRVKFGAMTAFLGIWLLVVYAPLAHMVWGGEGSFIGDIIGALDFAGGDVVTGPKFAIDAIAAGREGAVSLHRFVHEGQSLTLARDPREFYELDKSNAVLPIDCFDAPARQTVAHDASKAKTFSNDRITFTEAQVKAEASRCLGCGVSVVDQNKCIGCGLCTTRCEFDAIHLTRDVPEASRMYRTEDKMKAILPHMVKRAAKLTIKDIKEKCAK